VRGERWLLCGVADPIADAGWSDRGAALAVATFLRSAREFLDSTPLAEQALRDPERRLARLTRPLCARLLQRLDRESSALVASGELSAGWERPLYRDAFLDGAHAADNRMLWFQTTLLAGALGPRGGFALVLGEGTLRVDRADGPSQPQLASDGASNGDRARLISRWLEPDALDLGFRSLLPLGARELQLVIGTEGVARAPRLDRFAPADDGACRRLLEDLATGTPPPADADHLALAFARRRVQP
jgi:hypothetical protein